VCEQLAVYVVGDLVIFVPYEEVAVGEGVLCCAQLCCVDAKVV